MIRVVPVSRDELAAVRGRWGDEYVREVLGLVISARYAPRRERPKYALLTVGEVRGILELGQTHPVTHVARVFSVNKSVVEKILAGETFGAVTAAGR